MTDRARTYDKRCPANAFLFNTFHPGQELSVRWDPPTDTASTDSQLTNVMLTAPSTHILVAHVDTDGIRFRLPQDLAIGLQHLHVGTYLKAAVVECEGLSQGCNFGSFVWLDQDVEIIP